VAAGDALEVGELIMRAQLHDALAAVGVLVDLRLVQAAVVDRERVDDQHIGAPMNAL
jgi:hypothetical protein